jgi:hypothetical protein
MNRSQKQFHAKKIDHNMYDCVFTSAYVNKMFFPERASILGILMIAQSENYPKYSIHSWKILFDVIAQYLVFFS